MSFITDVEALRQRARQDMLKGAVTPDYTLNPQDVIDMLQIALSTECVCVTRYMQHYYMGHSPEFKEHAEEEMHHARWLAKRIVQLGGTPNFHPDSMLESGHTEPHKGIGAFTEMVAENLIAERVAIQTYREMIAYVGDADTTTRRLLEKILAKEEEHATDMLALFDGHSS